MHTLSRVTPLALLLALGGLAPAQTVSDDTVEFALPDLQGRTVRRGDFAARYLLLVYQGMP